MRKYAAILRKVRQCAVFIPSSSAALIIFVLFHALAANQRLAAGLNEVPKEPSVSVLPNCLTLYCQVSFGKQRTMLHRDRMEKWVAPQIRQRSS